MLDELLNAVAQFHKFATKTQIECPSCGTKLETQEATIDDMDWIDVPNQCPSCQFPLAQWWEEQAPSLIEP